MRILYKMLLVAGFTAMNDVIIARALHVLAVVIWIGGVSMATTVILPAVRRGDLGADRLRAFQAIEDRFIWQARAALLVVGLSGLHMTARLGLWGRFTSVDFWWMHAMVGVCLVFAFILSSQNLSSCTGVFIDRQSSAPTLPSLGFSGRIGCFRPWLS
jgi:uncharacterized membrane protein